jgi:thiamine-monophosphate kinase
MRSPHPFASEAQIIHRIQQLSFDPNTNRRALRLSIGDDAAAFKPRRNHLTLISTDALVEHVHFDLRYFAPEDLGWKALAVNLSDIAAMGGTPLYVTTSIALPRKMPAHFLEGIYRGLAKLARQHGVTLIGGDTCSSRDGVFLDVTIVGEVEPRKLVTRSSARPGDLLYVTGELGGSAMGLELLAQASPPSKRHNSTLIQRHLRPRPRCALGRFLAHRRLPSAMIDLSDGFSSDLHRLCQASEVGAVIWGDFLPCQRIPARQHSLLSQSGFNYALNGGEDYELLFTVPPRLRKRVPKLFQGVPIGNVGHITSDTSVWLWQGDRKTKLLPAGFDHFGNESRRGQDR